jgi:hypothetical protein
MKRTFLFLAIVIRLAACRKDKEVVDNTVARDNSTAEALFNDLLKVAHDISEGTEGIREYETGCIDNVTVDLESDPMTVLVDFGTDECIGADGRVRNGQILFSYTGRYRDEGTVITVTPIGYTVNGFSIEGTKTITNSGLNALDQPYFTIACSGEITAPANAYSVEWTTNRVRTWIAGSETLSVWDDEYDITGSSSGVNRFGNPFTASILTPLRVTIGCPWIVSGTCNLIPEGQPGRLIDFGNGECNAGYTVTVNGVDYPISGGN